MASLAPAEKAPAGKPIKVGSPHDPAEREADHIADLLTAPEEPALPVCAACAAGGAPCPACGGGGGGLLRPNRDPGGLNEPVAEAKYEHVLNPVHGGKHQQRLRQLRAKLKISQPNDVYEQEADQVADQVMRMALPMPDTILRQRGNEQSEEVQPKSLAEMMTPIVQRQGEATEKKPLQPKYESCEQKEHVQRSAEGTVQAQPDLESRLNASKSGGSPLPDEVRTFMEPRFKANFSQVRVHTDGEAVLMNQELGAQAFTHRNHIYYGAGKAPTKDELTGHELTHVVQQT
ncbi:MAG: DUF4157 domain-containing protein, partial [Cyanobacteriota bacterium]